MLIVVWSFAGPALALDGIKMSVGRGSDQVDALRISAEWVWPYRWYHRKGWLFSGYWEVGLNHWHNNIKPPRNFKENANATHEMWVVDATPVFRWQRETPTVLGLIPFLEIGTGVSLFSNRRLASKGFDPRMFGIRFQFRIHMGAGFRFGEAQQFELILRRYHYSNANIDRRNQGMDLIMLAYGYWF